MDLEHGVDAALRSVGDGGSALVWRRTCRELANGPRIGVAALTSTGALRAVEALEKRFPDMGKVALGYDPGDEDRPAPPSVREALLGVHAVIWATPAAQPLGARERRALAAIDESVGPEAKAVVVVDVHVLDRVSDDPEAELTDVLDRVAALVPDGWEAAADHDGRGLEAFVGSLRARTDALTAGRCRAVARLLLEDAQEGLVGTVEHEVAAVARHEAALASEDEAMDRARAAGTRAAAHTLGVLRRRTEELLVDLRTFLQELEGDLDEQLAGLNDVEMARRTVPHWLDHVVQGWLRDRLAKWRVQVHDDLRHVRLADEALAHAELLLPSLHPAPFKSDGRWRRALGLSAGIGGAAVLAAFQLWIPALLAAGGGVAWSVLDREGADARRDRLADRARTAVRRLGVDAERVLSEQLQRFEDQLATLGEDRAARIQEDRAEARAGLTTRLRLHRARLEEARMALSAFEGQIQALPLETPQE